MKRNRAHYDVIVMFSITLGSMRSGSMSTHAGLDDAATRFLHFSSRFFGNNNRVMIQYGPDLVLCYQSYQFEAEQDFRINHAVLSA